MQQGGKTENLRVFARVDLKAISSSLPATKSSLPIYYLVLKIANRAGFDATIVPGDSQPPQFQVRKGYLEIVTKKSHSDKAVLFKAIKTGTNEILSINGNDGVSMLPTRTKGKPIELVLRTKGNNERIVGNFLFTRKHFVVKRK